MKIAGSCLFKRSNGVTLQAEAMGCLLVEITTLYMVELTICCEVGWRVAKMIERVARRRMGAAVRRVEVTVLTRMRIRVIETRVPQHLRWRRSKKKSFLLQH